MLQRLEVGTLVSDGERRGKIIAVHPIHPRGQSCGCKDCGHEARGHHYVVRFANNEEHTYTDTPDRLAPIFEVEPLRKRS